VSNLNQEEKDLLNSVENDEWQPIDDIEQAKVKYQNYAKNQLNLNNIEVTLTLEDREKINKLATQLGKSVSSFTEEILHKYLQGELIEKP